jgi:malonyl-CoA O-methyltransferase
VSSDLTAATVEAYERWAPIYPPVAHNPLMRAEQHAMLEHWPAVTGLRALDLACGTGRYAALLAAAGAAHVVGLDICAPMLTQVAAGTRVRASMMQLPFVSEAFGVIVCGLALGHASSLREWMKQTARVLERGGTLLYSDFHPEATRAGLTRSFKDANDQTCTVPHRSYGLAAQREEAAAAGLTIEAVHEVRVGIELREPFAQSAGFYRSWHGLPIVLVVRARK